MGTAAVFAVCAQTDPTKHFRTILGMTWDGFPDNLKAIAETFKTKAAELQVKGKVKKRDEEACVKVLEAIAEDESEWLFTDDVENAEWVSFSAVYDPKEDTIDITRGMPLSEIK